jgi:peptidoglycan/xylan/chitin deacetylase (PgdA/CDA1 family)
MGAVKRILSDVKAAALSRIAGRRVDIRLPQATCSITFDDVPRSAFVNGVPILQHYEVPATFYVAAGLSPEDGFLAPDDVRTLVADGFEVGCHTFSHYSLYSGTIDGFVADAARNREAFVRDLGIPSPSNCSYPFGEVSAGAKRRLGQDYATLRSVYPGLNGTGTDLLLLRANAVYSSSLSWEKVKRLLHDAQTRSAWIIFYTHGVSDQPDPWSCTPAEMDRLIAECQSFGMHMQSVRAVSEGLKIPSGPEAAL